MYNHLKKILVILFFIVLTGTALAQQDFTKYVDPTIGNVSRFLVPTYPTMQLPNQMMRMFPIKQDYISDQVELFRCRLPVTGVKDFFGCAFHLVILPTHLGNKK